VARVPISEIGKGMSPYPYIFMLGQDRTERLLLAHLEEHGGAVQWETELRGLAQDEHGAVATLRHGGKETKVRARFVCGCDGARSAVRKSIGVEFAGGTYDSTFYVADVTARGGLVAEELNVGLFADRFMAFFPLAEADRYRYIGLLPPGLQREDAKPEDVIPEAEQLMGAKFDEVRWFSTYRVHHRVAAKFQMGRIFLVGDAGHVHSPVGAQGMNTGLQDAINLAWKLAEVLRYHAAEKLLATYEEERLPFAQSLVKTTDRVFTGVTSGSPLAKFFRLRLAPVLVPLVWRLPVARHALFGLVSQIGVTYADSTLSEGPGAGARMPWLPGRYKGERSDRWSLHMFGDEPPEAEAWARSRGMGIANWKGEQPQTVLVRPDGYIGYSSPNFDPKALDRYLTDVVGRIL
jgi:2-polyprenyl-6-methoxyphenol hydroxylase-like FAD-dependent oxidoreductase